MSFLYVAIGGGIGAVARYGVSLLLSHHTSAPSWGSTLLVNVVGGLLIGLLYGYFQRHGLGNSLWSLLLITGFCGGFTTFSTFSLDLFKAISEGQYLVAFLYPLLSVALSFAALALGILVTK